MDEEEINYRFLRKIQQLEKKSSTLSDLKSDFYDQLNSYLKSLQDNYDKESDSDKKNLMKEEISNTKKITKNIFEQREKKIVFAAISNVRGGSPDINKMLGPERDFYESLLILIKDFREDIIGGKPTEKINRNNLKNTNDVKKEIKDVEEDDFFDNKKVVMVLKDIPPFIGTDAKQYNIYKHDILTLPDDMTNMLVKRGIVKKLDV